MWRLPLTTTRSDSPEKEETAEKNGGFRDVVERKQIVVEVALIHLSLVRVVHEHCRLAELPCGVVVHPLPIPLPQRAACFLFLPVHAEAAAIIANGI